MRSIGLNVTGLTPRLLPVDCLAAENLGTGIAATLQVDEKSY